MRGGGGRREVPSVFLGASQPRGPRPRSCNRGHALAATGEPQPVGGGATDRDGSPARLREGASASTRREPTLGRLPMTCTAMLPISNPASRTSRAASASRVSPAHRPAPAGPCRSAPRGHRFRPPRTARRRPRGRRRRRRMPVESALIRPVQPGDPELASEPRAANACTSTPTPIRGSALMASVSQPVRPGRGTLGQHPLGVLEVVGCGHLEGQGVAVDDEARGGRPAHERGVVSGDDAGAVGPRRAAPATDPWGSAPREARPGRGSR